MTLGHELRTLDVMNASLLWMVSTTWDPMTLASRCYEQLRVEDDMDDSCSWANDFKYYEKLRVVDDVEDSWLWA